MSVARILGTVVTATMVLAASMAPAAAQPVPGTGAEPAAEAPAGSGAAGAAPVLGAGFVLEGVWLAPGVASLGWDDVEAAAGYELMFRSADGWGLLSEDEPRGGVSVAFEGSSAALGGLPQDAAQWWFAVRARNAFGVSEWSQSAAVAAPQRAEAEPAFDPFTAPTRSGIDLERLREAAATITPGDADCAAVPALDVEGVTVVEPPADLDDPGTELTVAEVARVSGGCLIVEYVALAGRSVAQVRDLLATDASVHAVGEPARGLALDDNTGAHTHTGGHHNDSGRADGEQWHLPQPTMQALWDGWSDDPDRQVVVAVIDTGVDITHPDFTENEDTTLPNTHRRIVGSRGCHAQDNNGHGTQMAGIIAAELGGGHVAGVAPEARILPLRYAHSDSGDCGETLARLVPLTATAAVARAVNEGARVINMSFGWNSERERTEVGGIPIEPGGAGGDSFELAVRAAAMLGVVSITSVGNDGRNGPEKRPAVYPDVLSVASIDSGGLWVPSSTANRLVDIAAPGDNILTTRASCTGTHCVDTSGGTSAAAAYVSGVVAHMLNRYPQASVGQVRRALEQSALRPPLPPRHPEDIGPFRPENPAIRLKWTPRGRDGDDAVMLEPHQQAPTAEYGRGIVDPAAAVTRLSALVGALEPVGAAGAFRSLSAGARHSCGLQANGAVVCWGLDAVVDETPDVAFASLSSPAGGDFVCGVRLVDSAVMCWGDVPDEITSDVAGARVLDPQGATAPEGRFEMVAVGDRHVCGVRPDGRVVCWGDDSSGQTDAPVAGFGQSSGGYVTAIAAGGEHTCALELVRERVTVQACWGEDQGGRLPPSGSLVAARQIAAGAVNTCVIGSDDTLHCFGSNSRGVLDAPAGSFAALDAGSHHMCAISAGRGRGLHCWGDNSDDRLAAPAGQYRQVAAGGRHSCALSVYARVVCWGDNSHGQAPQQAQLASLSLTAGGADLLAGRFQPDVTDYTVITNESRASLRASVSTDDETRSRICAGSGRRRTCETVSRTAPTGLTDGDTITVTVRALFGFGESRTYRINIVEPPRLASLSVVPAGSDCMPVCAPLALDPAFDPGVFDYTVLAPADLSQVTVAYTEVGGRAAVSPDDADGAVADYQVALGTDGDFVAVAAGGWSACGIKTDGTVACWPGHVVAPVGSFGAITAGTNHFCGIRTGGSVVCWGSDRHGETDAPAGSFNAVAAGYEFSCGIRTDGSVVCWGDNSRGQTDAPSGSFNAIAAGLVHSCGIRTGGSVVCWGDNRYGQVAAPSGSFSAVAAGRSHWCGIRTDKTVVCWGSNGSGRAAAPSGSFSAVAAGGSHSCGIRTGKTVVCWGSNRYGQAAAPSGSFNAVAAGSTHSCGVRTDNSVVCWGDDLGQADAPAGSFDAVSAGYQHSCGIRPGGGVVCWGSNSFGQADAPAGSFNAVAAAGYHTCGIRTDASVKCWGSNFRGQIDAPSGSFRAIAARWHHSCGVRTDAGVVCWGRNSDGQTDAPSGSFSAVASGYEYSCGLRTNASVVCWGSDIYAPAVIPTGSFSAVAAGLVHTCGIRTDNNRVECWGYRGQVYGPAGSFNAISSGWVHSCGIRTDNRVVCWGSNRLGQTDAPAGPFSAISSGDEHSCGIRTDNRVVCWGVRSPSLEPAASETVTLTVTSRARHTTPARYRVTIARPEPDWERAPRLAAQQSEEPAAAPSEPPPECEEAADPRICLGARPECIQDPLACPELQPDHRRAARPGPVSPDRDGASPHSDNPASGAASPATSPTAAASPVVCPAHNAPDGAVAVADSVLRAAINATLNKAPGSAVTAAEMAELTSLAVQTSPDGGRVVSLSGLEHAANLTELDLHGHSVSDISPLACLDKLNSLGLGANTITDIDPLKGLSSLTTVDLSNNEISDISALSAHSALAALDLSGNDIADIASLSQLSGLRSLNLGRNQITGLGPLRGLSSLERLHLYDNQITDLAPLANLSRLTALHLDHNQITDVSALSALSGLTRLGLGDNSISDIAPLRSLTGLETLYVFDNDLVDASALAALGGLRVLWIDGNDIASPYRVPRLAGLDYLDARHNLISDIAPLDTAAAPEATVHREPQRVTTIHISDPGLRSVLLAATDRAPGGALDAEDVAAIERLDVTGVELGDLSELRALKSLRRLNLHQNSLNSLDGLPALEGLDTLFVDFNNITDLAPLTAHRGLSSLGLVGNNIADLEPLAALTGLESLYLSANNIADLTALAGLRRLHHLRLTTNNIADLEPLKELAALTQLHLRHNNIADLEPLKELTALTYLDLRDNNITSLEPLAGLTGLQDLHIGGNHITDYSPLDHLTALTIHGRDHQAPTN